MRHGEALDLKVTIPKTGARLKVLPGGPVVQAGLHGARRGVVRENLDVRMARQPADSDGVVAVLMGKEDGVDAVEGFTYGCQQLSEPTGRKAGIDEHAGMFRLQQGAIAFTAAAKDAEPHVHGE
jgi:hypothetical protein